MRLVQGDLEEDTTLCDIIGNLFSGLLGTILSAAFSETLTNITEILGQPSLNMLDGGKNEFVYDVEISFWVAVFIVTPGVVALLLVVSLMIYKMLVCDWYQEHATEVFCKISIL